MADPQKIRFLADYIDKYGQDIEYKLGPTTLPARKKDFKLEGQLVTAVKASIKGREIFVLVHKTCLGNGTEASLELVDESINTDGLDGRLDSVGNSFKRGDTTSFQRLYFTSQQTRTPYQESFDQLVEVLHLLTNVKQPIDDL